MGQTTVFGRLTRWFRLARSAVVTGWAHTRRRWWRTAPFLPTPDPTHLAWRRTTAYGSDRPVERRDLIEFLLWADRQRKVRP